MPELVAGAQAISDQITSRWPNAKVLPSESNYSASKSLAYSISVDLNSEDSSFTEWLANQIIAFCRYKNAGYVRINSIRYQNMVASGTHSMFFWVWRTCDYDIGNKIEIDFTTYGETDDTPFSIPILNGKSSDNLVLESPNIDSLLDSIYSQSATKSTFLLARRMKELGFLDENVAPEGKQKYPKNAIRKMQDYMGLERTEYNQDLHWKIWGEMTISSPEV